MSETEIQAATDALVDMLAGKFRQAVANGATEDQAATAVRSLWLEAIGVDR